MQNQKEFYVKYLNNQPVKIETHFIGEQERRRPLNVVGDLVDAFQARPGSLLANTDSGLITLHLPDGIARPASGLAGNCFSSTDTTDTILDPGCTLSAIGTCGSNSKQPLIIKSSVVMRHGGRK